MDYYLGGGGLLLVRGKGVTLPPNIEEDVSLGEVFSEEVLGSNLNPSL